MLIPRKLALFLPISLLVSFASGEASGVKQKEETSKSAGAGNTGTWVVHLGPDCDLELIRIDAGTFLMGSSHQETQRDQAEGPQTKVTITKTFWLGKTEVTQAQYQAITGTNPSEFSDIGSKAPVERVSWKDAMEYCRLLTEKERTADRLPPGYVFTLPTEAQWEYACRAGTTRPYAGSPYEMAWFDENSAGTSHLVGLKKPNNWGLYDMSGNILEWCLDWYGDYPGGKVTDPKGPKRGHFKIARGGSWRMNIGVARCAARAGGSAGRRDYTIGFRLALCPISTPEVTGKH